MLRRKLMTILFVLTALLMALAIAAILGLNALFTDLDHINNHASAVVDDSNGLSKTISQIELELHRIQSGEQRHLDQLIDAVERMQGIAQRISGHYVVHEAAIEGVYDRLVGRMRAFERHVGALATAQDPVLASLYNREAITAAVELRGDIVRITGHAHNHAQEERDELTSRFRWLVIGLAIGFLLVINTSVILLMRTSSMILRPVDKLIAASRRLAMEQFDHRVSVGQNDEFDELAEAYNNLAGQLQENERRRVEMLQQAALTLNHELNNAIEIIELQLELLRRQGGRTEAFEKSMRQIHEKLRQMARVVEMLKHVRRVVLTDYTEGVKMLDLERSVQEAPTESRPQQVASEDVGPS